MGKKEDNKTTKKWEKTKKMRKKSIVYKKGKNGSKITIVLCKHIIPGRQVMKDTQATLTPVSPSPQR